MLLAQCQWDSMCMYMQRVCDILSHEQETMKVQLYEILVDAQKSVC